MSDNLKSTLSQIRALRLEKVKKLRDLGINPYPNRSARNQSIGTLVNDFEKYENKEVIVSGRLMSWREHGQLIFGDLQDMSGKIQLYIHENELEKTDVENQTVGFADLNLFDVGDILEATGTVTKTKRGQISIMPKKIKILTKAIRPLPEKWSGIQDMEERFRRRYLDMTMNPEIRERFVRRSKFWQATRNFLNENGFVEVNIPVLEHVTGGADANPFVTHYDALGQDFYLRISHELPLKRLIGAGFEKVYDIGPRFRNEGISDEHLPEHVAMEWYWAYASYREGMKFTQEMFKAIIKKVYGKLEFDMKGFHVNLEDEWKEIKFVDVIKERFGIDIFTDSVEKMNDVLKANKVHLGDDLNKSRIVDNLWKLIRKTIAGPAFLIDVPKFLSPLSKTSKLDDRITERFHPVIAGSELANAFSELNDPVDQLERFLEQQDLRDSGDAEAQMLDIDFVEMLEYGMAPAVGFGMSERVFWFFEDVTAKEGVPFPQLKGTVDKLTKEIYPMIKFSHEEEAGHGAGDKENISLPTVSITKLPKIEKVILNPEVKNKFPGIKFGYIVLKNVKVEKNNSELDKLKKEINKQVKAKYSDKEVRSSEKLKGYQEIYKSFGVDPRSRMNSSEALIKRISDGKGLYNINTIVDTYNVTSAEFEMAMAAYDLDKVKGTIELRFAKDGEEIVKIGDSEPTRSNEGELVYADEEGVVCLDFNYRDSDRTKITEKTKNVIVFVDGHKGISNEEIINALELLATRLEKFTGGKVVGYGMSED